MAGDTGIYVPSIHRGWSTGLFQQATTCISQANTHFKLGTYGCRRLPSSSCATCLNVTNHTQHESITTLPTVDRRGRRINNCNRFKEICAPTPTAGLQGGPFKSFCISNPLYLAHLAFLSSNHTGMKNTGKVNNRNSLNFLSIFGKCNAHCPYSSSPPSGIPVTFIEGNYFLGHPKAYAWRRYILVYGPRSRCSYKVIYFYLYLMGI